MKGYHKNEEATADSLTEDGFFKTGDLGYYKPGKGLFITDRIKELIKVMNNSSLKYIIDSGVKLQRFTVKRKWVILI